MTIKTGLNPGQTLVLRRTSARYTVTEVDPDGTRAVVSGVRTGARLLVVADESGLWGRVSRDNGAPGTSLFDSLVPVGPRYRMIAWTS
jgi:hypothetical protein